MQVHEMEIDKVVPYDQNPRDNSSAVEKVADSIREFGWQQPIVIDEDKVILAGHTRHLAALSMGLDVVPVLVANGLTEAQKKAYRIVDNKTSELAQWDKELLKSEFLSLQELDFDLNLTGFGLEEIARMSGEDLLQFDEELDEIDEAQDFGELETENKNHVKMLMLYLNTETEPKFKQMCVKIQEKHGMDNLTDAVYMAVSNECKDL